MARTDLIKLDGKVVESIGRGLYSITLDNGASVKARMGGKMSRHRIRVVVGDKVTVSLSPYDVTHGIITHRH